MVNKYNAILTKNNNMHHRLYSFLDNCRRVKRLLAIRAVAIAVVPALSAALPARGEDAIGFANFGRYAEANAQLAAQPVPADRVVLMGNSITDFWPARGPHLFETHPEIVGRGISGQTSWQFLLRFRRDVIDLHPSIVVINYGTNDIALNAGTYDEDATFGNIRSMVDLARANGIGVVLASCLPAEGFSWRPAVTDAMDSIRSLNARVRAFAEAEGIPYADYYSALVNAEGTAMDSRYANDRPAVHPNAEGYAVMEGILLDAIARARRQP